MKAISFKNFIFERTLSSHHDIKQIYLLGRLISDTPESGIKALIKLEKQAFDEKLMDKFNAEVKPVVEESMYFNNDIYYKYLLEMTSDFTKV